jgi:hypothetical protein
MFGFLCSRVNCPNLYGQAKTLPKTLMILMISHELLYQSFDIFRYFSGRFRSTKVASDPVLLSRVVVLKVGVESFESVWLTTLIHYHEWPTHRTTSYDTS